MTFQLLNGNTNVGAAVTSGDVVDSKASVDYLLPAGTSAGSYTIKISYPDGPNYTGSSDSASVLAVTPAATAIVAADASVPFNAEIQNAQISATVTSPAGVVNEGVVTFQVLSNGTPVGTAGDVRCGE